MTDTLNEGLVGLMREKLPPGQNLANYLMDILFLSKVAVYCRLRGEVPFTLTEAAVISRKLGFSLDRLAGLDPGNTARNRSRSWPRLRTSSRRHST